MSRLRIVLVSPRIVANVGNAARTAASLNAELVLVKPFGFIWDESKLRRNSVGYWDRVQPTLYRDADDFWSRIECDSKTEFVFVEKDGEEVYFDHSFGSDVVLIFGNEEEGVDSHFWQSKRAGQNLVSCRIPMSDIRCLNLATCVGILGYEVFRQWQQGVKKA
jgi:tRNA (cytidine(34)-2'-O)-methyltransferase